jgi:hypothetical protein
MPPLAPHRGGWPRRLARASFRPISDHAVGVIARLSSIWRLEPKHSQTLAKADNIVVGSSPDCARRYVWEP